MNLADALAIARADYARLKRYALRRDHFLAGLDWELLGDAFARETRIDDEYLMCDLADAWLYMDHLEFRLEREGNQPETSKLRFLLPVRRWHALTDHGIGTV